MKHLHRLVMGLGAGLFILSSSASAEVLGSKHDLSAGSGNNEYAAAITADTPITASDQVCVFCHTPHGAAAAADQIIPLWNRTTTSSSFTLYADTGAGTLDGAYADDGTGSAGIGGVSLACLSCHDGSIALASVLNAPGSGPQAETAWTTGAGWTNNGSSITAGALDSSGPAYLGTDLSNDHPVAIQYAGGGYEISAGGGGFDASTPNDLAFVAAVIGGASSTQAWVDVDTSGTKTAGDLPLFTNTLPASTTLEPFVECASCHDPHGTSNDMFLRAAAQDSAICTSCHVK